MLTARLNEKPAPQSTSQTNTNHLIHLENTIPTGEKIRKKYRNRNCFVLVSPKLRRTGKDRKYWSLPSGAENLAEGQLFYINETFKIIATGLTNFRRLSYYLRFSIDPLQVNQLTVAAKQHLSAVQIDKAITQKCGFTPPTMAHPSDTKTAPKAPADTASKTKEAQAELKSYFQLVDPSSNSWLGLTQPYIYKKEQPGQVKIGLRKPPVTAEEFYNLAVTIYQDRLKEREDSYFCATLEFPQTADGHDLRNKQWLLAGKVSLLEEKSNCVHKKAKLQKITAEIHSLTLLMRERDVSKKKAFIVNLLADAAQAGMTDAALLLSLLINDDPSYSIRSEPLIEQALLRHPKLRLMSISDQSHPAQPAPSLREDKEKPLALKTSGQHQHSLEQPKLGDTSQSLPLPVNTASFYSATRAGAQKQAARTNRRRADSMPTSTLSYSTKPTTT